MAIYLSFSIQQSLKVSVTKWLTEICYPTIASISLEYPFLIEVQLGSYAIRLFIAFNVCQHITFEWWHQFSKLFFVGKGLVT